MKLSSADRSLVWLISRAYPPAAKAEPAPSKDVDWVSVIARAERQGLAPLLFDSMKKADRLRELPPQALTDFRRAYLGSANRSEENFIELAALLSALAEARIPVILLKGAALAPTLYERIAQRPMCDLDLLIPKTALSGFATIMAERGFVGDHNLGRGFEEEYRSQMCYRRPGVSRLMVEPHWHLFETPYYAEKIPVEWFWERTVPVEIRGREARMLSPTAALLHLAAHYYVHHKGIGLRPLYDLARLLSMRAEQIDGQALTEASRNFGLLFAVQSALLEAAAIWQFPLPEHFSLTADRAGGIPPADLMVSSRYLHHIRDWVGVAGWKARLKYLGKLFFPGLEYLRERYGMRNNRLAGFYYAYRVFRGLIAVPGMLLAFLRRYNDLRREKELG